MTTVTDIPLDTILAKLRELAPAIKAEGVTRLAIFGSRARGDARSDSDLDIVIETLPRENGKPFFDFFKVMHLIEDTTGITTQLSYYEMLKLRIKERIADDLVEVI